jgi:hypothetical protein
MAVEADALQRIARLEEQYKHLSEKVDDLADASRDTNAKVTGLHEFILEGKGQVKGFIWAGRLVWLGLYGIMTVAGFKLAQLVSWGAGK